MTISEASAIPKLGATRKVGDGESRRPQHNRHFQQSEQNFEDALRLALGKREMLYSKLPRIALEFHPLLMSQRAAVVAYDAVAAPFALPSGFFLEVVV